MAKQSEYTYNIISQFIKVPPVVVTVTANSVENAYEKMWELHMYKSYRLTHIDGKEYISKEAAFTPCASDPEERYWKNAATCAERFSYDDRD